MHQKSLSNRTAFLNVLGMALAVAMLPVLWPKLDIAVASFFYQSPAMRDLADSLWVTWVNEYTPDLFRALGLLLTGGWIVVSVLRRSRRLGIVLAFTGLSLLLGPGLVTWAVKEHQLRARPMDVVQFGGQREFTPALQPAQQCTDNCAFTSGHVACGFFLASLMLLDPRRRWYWVASGVTAGLLIGLARMLVNAHWLSDVLWAFPITLLSSALVWVILGFFYQHRRSSSQL
ncbi:MAG: phosphatase PAP2 family protein [Hylemonella sp.]